MVMRPVRVDKIRLLALCVAVVIWVPCVPAIYRGRSAGFVSTGALSTTASGLMVHQRALWDDPGMRRREVEPMRRSNPEWDFMGRSFDVWAMANAALRDEPTPLPPSLKGRGKEDGERGSRRAEYLLMMDRIIDDTLATQRSRGMRYFLMGYAREGRFVQQPERSQFEDGEIALMLGMRRMVEEKPAYGALQRSLVHAIVDRMTSSPTLSCESYPNECWTFCNACALAAIATSDYLDGTDHRALFSRWVAFAKTHLTDKRTGLLISAYTIEGKPIYGPEGSSIWFVCHMLDVVDPAFASDQYARAKRVLRGSVGGFDHAREYPKHWHGSNAIDSGVVVPGIDVSAGSTGMACLAASTFGDREFLDGLASTMDFGGFPVEDKTGLHYAAGNQVSDAVYLYASTMGPVWERLRGGRQGHGG